MTGSTSVKNEHWNQICDKIKSVGQISIKSNLLAINSTIEVIHASELLSGFEKVVESNLLIQARLFAEILLYDPDFLFQDGQKLAAECGIEEFYVTDEKGIIEHTNMPGKNGTSLDSQEFMKILSNPGLEIALKSTQSSIHNSRYKTVAIGRRDRDGIIQLGSYYERASAQIAINGFGVVTREAKRLADNINAEYCKMESATNESAGSEEDPDFIRGYSHAINYSVDALYNIAKQINLLGVRASIEAAHTTDEKQAFDDLLSKHMIVEARLASILIERRPGITCDDIVDLAERSGVGEFWITDENGAVELTNIEGGTQFSFTNEGQTAPYMQILADPKMVVTAPPAKRAIDGKVYKFAAVARREKKGIFQIGIPAKIYGNNTAKGFAEVARQIKDLAQQLKDATTEIEETLKKLLK